MEFNAGKVDILYTLTSEQRMEGTMSQTERLGKQYTVRKVVQPDVQAVMLVFCFSDLLYFKAGSVNMMSSCFIWLV